MTSDRTELAKQLYLSRNGGGSWAAEMEDHFDFLAAMNEADFVLRSGWLAGVNREANAEALIEAADALYSDDGPDNPLSAATWLRARAAAIREAN